MLARDVMTTPMLTVRPDTDVAEIAELLLECRISAVPVVDDDGAVRGIVSEGELIGFEDNLVVTTPALRAGRGYV